MIFQNFSPRQLLTLSWWSREPFSHFDGILCDGSIRSGKTLSMAVGFLLWSMSSFHQQSFAICGKTIETLRRNVIDLLPSWLQGVCSFRDSRSSNRLSVSAFGHKNTFFLFGGKDDSSFALIQGITLAGVFLDETALMPRSFVEQAVARCSVPHSKLWFNCNPQGPNHWFYQEWVQKAQQRNILYLHFTMQDNPSLDPAIRQRYQAMFSGTFYDRYIRGLWVAAGGLVYDQFSITRHVTAALPPTSGPLYVSVDYGTRNPTAFLLWQHAATGQWVCLREYYWDGRRRQHQKTDGEYADDLRTFLSGQYPQTVIVDPSAASFITELRKQGFHVLPADNAVLTGIRHVSQLLNQNQLLFSSSCSATIQEFQSYVWDDSASSLGVDKPLKEHDHCMDAVRYFVSSILCRQSARAAPRPKGL